MNPIDNIDMIEAMALLAGAISRKGPKVKRGARPAPGEKHYLKTQDGRWYEVEHGTRRRVRDEAQINELEARAAEPESQEAATG